MAHHNNNSFTNRFLCSGRQTAYGTTQPNQAVPHQRLDWCRQSMSTRIDVCTCDSRRQQSSITLFPTDPALPGVEPPLVTPAVMLIARDTQQPVRRLFCNEPLADWNRPRNTGLFATRICTVPAVARRNINHAEHTRNKPLRFRISPSVSGRLVNLQAG
jgi:hypothetical protein